jgi:hypothetical protein
MKSKSKYNCNIQLLLNYAFVIYEGINKNKIQRESKLRLEKKKKNENIYLKVYCQNLKMNNKLVFSNGVTTYPFQT